MASHPITLTRRELYEKVWFQPVHTLAKEYGISDVGPVISRAHHLTHGAITESDWVALRDAGERIWLFDPTPQQAKKPSVATYLRKRPSTGGFNRAAF